MKRIKLYYLHFVKLVIFLFLSIPCFGQVAVSLKQLSIIEQSNLACYQIELYNKGEKDLLLNGQNYRLYYDSRNAIFNSNHLKKYLPNQYTDLLVVQNYHNIDASGFGILPFESDMGFINIATDYIDIADKRISIPAFSRIKIPIAEICFNIENGKLPDIIWAQPNLSQTYATAFVEIAVYDGLNYFAAPISEYRLEQNELSSLQATVLSHTKIFPNPFHDEIQISFNYPLRSDAILTLYDIFGKEYLKTTLYKGDSEVKIETHQLPNGAYFFEILEGGQKRILQAIKSVN